MKKLFDASAIILLTKNHPHEAPELLKHENILDLTLYEIGNTIWKINKLYKKGDRNTVLESIEQAYYLTSLMNIHVIENRQMYISIMENAFQYNLTYYDAAYLAAAQRHKLALVTEDKKLAKATVKADVPTIDIDTLLKTI